jgi:hypothetical protein
MTARRSGALQDIQENRCFYCGSAMKQDPHVDHFIGNLDKGDMLGAPAHLAHWVKRNRPAVSGDTWRVRAGSNFRPMQSR